MTISSTSHFLVMSAAGTALVLDTAGPGLPRVVHWGADPGPMDEAALEALALGTLPTAVSVEIPVVTRLVPQQVDGWTGRPGISGHRDGGHPHLRWRQRECLVDDRTVRIAAGDEAAGVSLRTEIAIDGSGVLRVRHEIANDGPGTFTVDAANCLLPVGTHATEVLDFTGRWPRERVPQRGPLRHGLTLRESRRGRTGHDATGLLTAGESGFGFGSGEVWAVHAGWSGNHLHYVERLPESGPVLGAGELLGAGEIRLAPGEAYQTPVVHFAWSGEGLDGLAARLHTHLRSRDVHPGTSRPVVLNTWEAVYFDHDLAKLTALADRAARIGVERFVLDDGWFHGRRNDRAGLGDWTVDADVWPEGLHPLVKHVRALGMQVGLWVEPEMVNPDSDLARAHPDWILAAPDRTPPEHRHQQVLDLARPEAFEYLLARLDALATEYDLDYLKWDHNRDLLEPVHDGRHGVHEQTLATYRLLDELRARHSRLEIESCSSGGARIDYGILQRTDRVWASDTIDPLERQDIERWTGLLLPPELVGSHVGSAKAHTTGRTTHLNLRLATALFGHAGIEWDLTACSEAELDALAAWIALHKRLRPLLHSGRTVHADHPDPAVRLHGVVAADRRHAVFAHVQMTSSTESVPARLRFPGLDPAAVYTVTACDEIGLPADWRRPEWLRGGPLRISGAALGSVGLTSAWLEPATAVVLELRAE